MIMYIHIHVTIMYNYVYIYIYIYIYMYANIVACNKQLVWCRFSLARSSGVWWSLAESDVVWCRLV